MLVLPTPLDVPATTITFFPMTPRLPEGRLIHRAAAPPAKGTVLSPRCVLTLREQSSANLNRLLVLQYTAHVPCFFDKERQSRTSDVTTQPDGLGTLAALLQQLFAIDFAH